MNLDKKKNCLLTYQDTLYRIVVMEKPNYAMEMLDIPIVYIESTLKMKAVNSKDKLKFITWDNYDNGTFLVYPGNLFTLLAMEKICIPFDIVENIKLFVDEPTQTEYKYENGQAYKTKKGEGEYI